MSRAVGYPASIVAQMVLSGELRRAGVASPIRDVPPDAFFEALARRGLTVTEREIEVDECYVGLYQRPTFAYSTFACCRIGRSGSASFQRASRSW